MNVWTPPGWVRPIRLVWPMMPVAAVFSRPNPMAMSAPDATWLNIRPDTDAHRASAWRTVSW